MEESLRIVQLLKMFLSLSIGSEMRILVTGNAGAGKTTLANALGTALRLPVHGLDRVVWQPGWKNTPPTQKEQALEQLMASSNDWIIEGVSQTVMEAADTIIFLDVPRHVCLWQCARRNWRYLFRSRPELPGRCPEILIIPKLLSIIWNFPAQVRPLILAHIEQNKKHKKIIRLFGEPSWTSLLSLVTGENTL